MVLARKPAVLGHVDPTLHRHCNLTHFTGGDFEFLLVDEVFQSAPAPKSELACRDGELRVVSRVEMTDAAGDAIQCAEREMELAVALLRRDPRDDCLTSVRVLENEPKPARGF